MADIQLRKCDNCGVRIKGHVSEIIHGEVKVIVWGRELRYRYCSDECRQADEDRQRTESKEE